MARCCGSGDVRKSRDRHRQAKNPRITHEFGPSPGCRVNICSLYDCPNSSSKCTISHRFRPCRPLWTKHNFCNLQNYGGDANEHGYSFRLDESHASVSRDV